MLKVSTTKIITAGQKRILKKKRQQYKKGIVSEEKEEEKSERRRRRRTGRHTRSPMLAKERNHCKQLRLHVGLL